MDIFFALSGFLITGILRRDRNQPAFWKTFYIKRATRIIPPLLIAILAAAVLFPIPWKKIWWCYALFMSNVANVLPGVDTFSLSVLWSLAVEEHFYILWPLAILYIERRILIRLLILLLIAEPLLRAACTPLFHTWTPIGYLTPFRLDGLAAGSLLALLLEKDEWRDRLKIYSGPLFTIAAAAFCIFNLPPAFRFRANGMFNVAGYSLLALTSAFLLAFVFLNENSRTSKLLSRPPVVFLGLISYGFYLYHSVVINLLHRLGAEHNIHHLSRLTPVYFAISLLVSWLSYTLYEKKFLKWGHEYARRVRAIAGTNHENVHAQMSLEGAAEVAKGS